MILDFGFRISDWKGLEVFRDLGIEELGDFGFRISDFGLERIRSIEGLRNLGIQLVVKIVLVLVLETGSKNASQIYGFRLRRRGRT